MSIIKVSLDTSIKKAFQIFRKGGTSPLKFDEFFRFAGRGSACFTSKICKLTYQMYPAEVDYSPNEEGMEAIQALEFEQRVVEVL